MREALFEIYTWILCLSYLHEKETSRIQSLYLYFIKIVLFWLRNIRFQYKTPGHYSTGVIIRRYTGSCRFMEKIDVKLFLLFIVAENTGIVNIWK